MSDGITAQVVGDRQLVARFSTMPERVGESLHRAMLREMLALGGHVKRSKLSGQVLKNRTGHLRAGVTPDAARAPGGVVGRVGVYSGPPAIYGRVHEYGFVGEVQVRAHVRGPSRRVAQRAARFARRAEALGFDGTLYHQAAGGSLVRAHTRRVAYPERSFLRSALAERAAAIFAGLRAAALQAVRAGRSG